MRILIIANTGWYLYKFRYNLIKALIRRGDVVCISCPKDDYSQLLVAELGVPWEPIPSNPRRIVPHKEINFVLKLFFACKRFKPDVCLTYTPRVNCYITLVPLRIFRTKLVRNISGLGDSLSSGQKIQTMLATFLYQRAYNSLWTFYQNQEDLDLGIKQKFSNAKNTSLLPGSGVDLENFHFTKRTSTEPHRFLLAARLIPAKGYLDYLELASQFSSDDRLEFHLAGAFSNESGITEKEFQKLVKRSGVVYHGYTEDLTTLYAQSDVFVLPSTYGEGLPRVLLEAASCGCALLAYPNPGSNRAINNEVNGWTVSGPTVKALHEKIEFYLSLSVEVRQKMSWESRQHVENGFSESVVIDAYLELLSQKNSGLA